MSEPEGHDDGAFTRCSAADMAPLTVPARAGSLGLISDYCQEAARRAGLDRRTSYRLRLAVDEVATNVITHGYPALAAPDASASTLTLRVVSCGDGMLTLVLEDQAPAFDPRGHSIDEPACRDAPLEQRAEGGLGLFLAHRSVDALDYECVDGCNRNIFTVFGVAPRCELPPHAQARHRTLARGEAHLVLAVGRLANYRALQRALESAGYALTITRDGRELLRLLHVRGLQRDGRDPTIDIVLLGRDLAQWASWLEQIRSDPRTSGVPVQVIVERKRVFDDALIEQCLALGADDCVAATLPAALLLRRLDATLERRGLQRELRAVEQRQAELERIAHTFTGTVVPLGVALSDESDAERLLERIVGEAMTVSRAACGVLYTLAHEGEALRVALVQVPSRGLRLRGNGADVPGLAPLPLYADDAPRLRDPAVRAALTGETSHIAEVVGAAPQLAGFDLSRVRALEQALGDAVRLRSVLTVALRAGTHTTGVLQLFNARDVDLGVQGATSAFGGYHRAVIESLASQAALALHNRALLSERQSLRALERELELGRQVQQDFLPSSLPQLSGWQIAARLDAARAVSGDFYDTFELTPDGCPAFVVADVCDKGAGAAFFMGLTRSLLRAFSQRGWTRHGERPAVTGQTAVIDLKAGEPATLARILQSGVGLTNDYIATNHAELSMFATMFYAALEPLRGRLCYINAGHPPALVLSADGRSVREHLARTGPAIGIIPGAGFEVGAVTLEPGETLLAYTDGVTEARDAQGRFLGRAGLERLLGDAAPRAADAEALLDAVLAGVEAHVGEAPQHDDIALLAVRRLPR